MEAAVGAERKESSQAIRTHGEDPEEAAGLRALRAGCGGGVGGGQPEEGEAGKGQLCETTGSGADVNTAGLKGGSWSGQRNDAMPDLDQCLSERLTDGCVISETDGGSGEDHSEDHREGRGEDHVEDHRGFNGFLEWPCGRDEEEEEEGGPDEGLSRFGVADKAPKVEDADLEDIIGEIWDPHVDTPFPDVSYNVANGDVSRDRGEAEWTSCDRANIANGGLHFLRTLDRLCGAQLTERTDRPSSPSAKAAEEEVNEDSALSEEDEDVSELSLPVRPQTLRTNFNLSVSLSCDATPLSPGEEEAGFYYGEEGYGSEDFRSAHEAGRRQSAPDKLPDLIQHADGHDPKLMPKRFGIADFFTRSLFSRKPKEPKALTHNATGWRLFGKAPVKESDFSRSSDDSSPQEEQPRESGGSSCPQCPLTSGRRKNLEFEPLSTTALILEDRPANLPAKSVEETQRHKQEYEEMVAGAKRREMKDAQKKKLQMKERHRHEDSISNAMVIWNTEILPHWDSVKGSRRVRELWWQGLPPSVRGRVWSLAIGNELNITPELYEIFLSRAKEKWRSYSETSSVNDSESAEGASLADRESSLDLIKLDISRTFPSLFIFQKGGPYHDLLHSVLGAYTCYRPDIGYVQGMSFIAAVLILNLEEADAFITFANLLNKPCQMAFFRVDHDLMLKYFAAFEVFFEENLPRLFNHFQSNNLSPDLYLIDWIFTLYSKSLPLDVACRVWDVFCRDGEESLFRTGLGILRLYEDILLQMDFIHIAQFLSRLPEDLHSHTLFHAMANTHMVSRNRRWTQVFSVLMKDTNKDTDRNGSPALRS